ncbi:MalY/PatB family protein [Aliikangiella sp. IMCC44359]|uniref:MalY/PatB family protein n=1 Tax=Aliikangiella sp. IMCC44359 TaxID=3459125 RepID=UPI00403AD863
MSDLFECFDFPPNRQNSDSYKWDYNLTKFGRSDIIPLWIADMDFATPKVIIKALEQRLKHPVMGYGYRTKNYIRSIQNWLLQRHQWKVPVDALSFYPPGTVSAVNNLVTLLTKEEDEIIVQTPAYPPLMSIVKHNNRILIENPLVKKNNEYEIDFLHLKKVISKKTKLLIFCSPHNPTGRVWRKEELLRLAKLCREHEITVISDEVHADLVWGETKHTHFNKLPASERPVSATIISPGKTFNLAALPQSTIICDNQRVNRLLRHNINTAHLSLDNVMSAVATQAGYEKGAEWLDLLLLYLKKNRDFIESFLQNNLPQVKLSKAQGTYLAWLDFSALEMEHSLINKLLIEQAGVGLHDGLLFGKTGKNHFRINFACSMALLQQALTQIHRAITDNRT